MFRLRLGIASFFMLFRDAANGDPVAIVILLGMFLFLAAILAFGAWVLWKRKQDAENFRKKVEAKRKKEDGQYKASKKVKEI